MNQRPLGQYLPEHDEYCNLVSVVKLTVEKTMSRHWFWRIPRVCAWQIQLELDWRQFLFGVYDYEVVGLLRSGRDLAQLPL